jgi:hypothetical protein
MEYKIRKLKWEGKLSKEPYGSFIIARTCLGSYTINRIEPNYIDNTIQLSYYFDEYDEGYLEVKTIKQAKEEAQKLFEERGKIYIEDFLGLDK